MESGTPFEGKPASQAVMFALFLVGSICLVAANMKLFHFGVSPGLLLLWVAVAFALGLLSNRLSRSSSGVWLYWSPFSFLATLLCGPIAGMSVDIVGRIGNYWNRKEPGESRAFALSLLGAFAACAAGSLAISLLFRMSGRLSLFFLLSAVAVHVAAALFTSSSMSRGRFDRIASLVSELALPFGIAIIGSLFAEQLLLAGHPWATAVLVVPPLAIIRARRAESDLQEHYYGTIAALSQMLQRSHPYTGEHVTRVSRLAEKTATQLGLNSRRARLVREAAVLHDIGKIAVDERILDKSEPLDPSERAAVQKHSAFGAEIVANVDEFGMISRWIRSHHERPDGNGYPDGLLDGEIPIESKIIAVADSFDAMTSNDDEGAGRNYRKPMSEAEALDELERCAGRQFDARVIRAFKDAVLEGANS